VIQPHWAGSISRPRRGGCGEAGAAAAPQRVSGRTAPTACHPRQLPCPRRSTALRRYEAATHGCLSLLLTCVGFNGDAAVRVPQLHQPVLHVSGIQFGMRIHAGNSFKLP